jgi:type I restriction enzyme S subunit
MKQYETYKGSGVEWIGEIPEHWSVKPLKHLVTCNDEVLNEKTEPQKKIKYIEIGDVSSDKGITNFTEYEFAKAPSRARRIVKEGDVLVSTVRTYLKAIASISESFDGYIASTGFAVLTPLLIESDYLGHTVLTEGLIGEIISMSKGVSYPSITAQDLMSIKIPLPDSSDEQTQIANYLNLKTEQLDILIDKKEQLISLLQEERTAMINHTVTKGLDQNAPMKDSGIDWIGEIPEHWKMKKLR